MRALGLRGTAILRLLRLAALLPLPVAHALGTAIGLCLYAFPTESRRVARRNLELCFPALTPRERRGLLRRALAETGKGLLEAGALWLWPPHRVLDRVREVVGAAELERALVRGRGVVLLAPHLGCWELAGLYCSTRHPMTILYRPFPTATVDALMRAARERVGARLVPADARGVLALRRALQRGELVGILPDQDPARGAGVFAPFFGVPAHTMTLAGRLLAQSGATALFVFGERLPRGEGFRLHFLAADETVADADREVAASALNQGIERCIARAPAQYLWVYRRFKTRPQGVPSYYPRSLGRRWRRRLRRQAH
jgi:KDO2-lipid IV(A) lauroyltransferase